MAVDLDNLPTYDDVLKEGTNKMSSTWTDNLATHIQTLQGYLSSLGMFAPRVTTVQRDLIQTPVNGQFIYNTTLNKFQGYENGAWVNFV